MWVFCGLGNPGKEYLLTRHNFGFIALDFFAKKQGLFFSYSPEIKAEISLFQTESDLQKALLVKPQTFMNLSGEAIKRLPVFLKKRFNEDFSLSKFLVVYDDVNFPLGKIKLLPKGGDGGHNGLKSIIQAVGTKEFPRLKLGIGRPSDKSISLRDWVLGNFSEKELETVEKVCELVSELFLDLLHTPFVKVMTKYNSL